MSVIAGLPAGRIEQVFKGRISLHVRHDVARHDGIQIDVPGEERPFGFSLQNMQVGGKNVFEAKAGQEAVIMLPPKAPKLEKGLPVYLASSGRVKGAYGYDRPKPGEFRQRLPLDVRVTIGADKVTAAARRFFCRAGRENFCRPKMRQKWKTRYAGICKNR